MAVTSTACKDPRRSRPLTSLGGDAPEPMPPVVPPTESPGPPISEPPPQSPNDPTVPPAKDPPPGDPRPPMTV